MATYYTLVEPTIGENTYVVINKSNQALIIDPGVTLQRLQLLLREHGATPVAIVLTHGHYDHIANIDAIVNTYAIPTYIHTKDAKCFRDPRANLGNIIVTSPATIFKGREGVLEVGDFSVNYWHTPGHSPGSSVLQIDADAVMISGDVLFSGSVGRYDFPTSNETHHQASLKHIFATFSDAVKVLPGHGGATTIGQERQHNPFKSWF